MRILRTLATVFAVALAVAAIAAAASRHSAATSAGGNSFAEASALQAQFVKVVNRVSPSVVQIETSQGLGSGDIFDKNGDIVTNNHVVEGASKVTVTLANGRRYPGKVVGTFAPDDLAVVKISAPNLNPIAFAPSSKLEVGDIALAVGNPLGLRSSVTEGIVSAVNRTVSEGSGSSAAIAQAIQTSAPINPGNSGGALVDVQGRLIGIPTLAASDPQMGGAAVGIGFAIPSDTVKDIAGQIVKHGKVVNSHRAYLGVSVGDTSDGSGVYVGSVQPGTPAAKAGITAGDVIVAVDGHKTPTTTELTTVLTNLKPGQTVSVQIVHASSGQKQTVKLTLGSFPGSS
jgi:putative serine protease PepD